MRINLNEIKSFLVYDYEIPFSTRLAKQFFWPLYRYQVAVTGFNTHNLNVFEFVMLQFLSAENYSIETLKKLTGMEADLIDFLQQRLHHKGFLDENYYVTESGKAHIEYSNSTEAEPAFFYVYADPFTGALLPYIEPIEHEQQITTDIINAGKQFIGFTVKTSLGKESAANNKKIWAFQFPEGRITAPSDHALSNVIRKVENEQLKEHIGSGGASIRLCSSNPDKVYLAVHFVLQNGNSSKWLITEGFSGDISALFAEALEKLAVDDQQAIQESRNHLIKKMLNIPEKEAKTLTPEQQKKLQPYYIYPEIYKKLKEVEKINAEYLSSISSSDKQRERNERVQKYIINLYEVLEWAFYHSAGSAPCVTSIVNDIKNLSSEEIKNRALAVAEHLHLHIDENDKKLFAVKYGSITGCLKEQPQLIPLFVFHLLCAEHTSAGNFHTLLKKEPEIITRFAWFKKKRDPAKHGESIALTEQERSDAYNICYTTLEVLFPGTERKGQQKDPASADDAKILSDTERARLNRYVHAEKAAEERLGFAVQRRLPNALYSGVINIEKAFADAGEGDYDISVLNNFYNLFDALFCYINADLPVAEPFITAKISLEKAERTGFRVHADVTTLEAVNSERLELALKNKKISLQASFLCFLFKAPDELLRQVSVDCDQLVTAMNDLAGFRGHGDFINVTEEENRNIQVQIPGFRELMYRFIHCVFSRNLI